MARKASSAVQGYLKQTALAKPSPSIECDLIKSLESGRDSATVSEFTSHFSALVVQIRRTSKA